MDYACNIWWTDFIHELFNVVYPNPNAKHFWFTFLKDYATPCSKWDFFESKIPTQNNHGHWWERVNNTVVEAHLSVTSRSSRVRTRTARLTDRDAHDCAISPPPISVDKVNYFTNSYTAKESTSKRYMFQPETDFIVIHFHWGNDAPMLNNSKISYQ